MNELVAKNVEIPRIVTILEGRMSSFTEALPPSIPSERFVRIIKMAINKTPELMDCTPASVVAACEKAAADGLVLDGREAALVVYNTKKKWKEGNQWKEVWVKEAQYLPMYQGLLKRIRNTGQVSTIAAHIVYERETQEDDPRTGRPRFLYVAGDDEHIEHSPIVFGERGPPVGVYSVIKHRDGGVSRCVMDIEDVKRIARLQSKNVDSESGSLKGIWKQHFEEMAKKTCLRRHVKLLAMDSDINRLFAEGDDPSPEDFDQRDDEERARDEGKTRGPKRASNAAARLAGPPADDGQTIEHDPETGEIHQQAAPAKSTKTAPKPAKAATPPPQEDDGPNYDDAPGPDDDGREYSDVI